MRRGSILSAIKKINHPVFTTFELSSVSGKSSSAVTQSLNNLVKDGFVIKVCRGLWADAGNEHTNPYAVIPYLLPRHRAYVSFVSALHLYDMVEQIPQEITLASTLHTKTIRTSLGTFSFHQLTPEFFDGFVWYKNTGKFLIAEPEKALVDSLYLSARKKKQFGYFPELTFHRSFSFRKVMRWVGRIPNAKIRAHVLKKVEELRHKYV